MTPLRALRPLLLGAAAYVPGLNGLVVNRGTHGSDEASYCYGVWMKHWALLHQSGLDASPRAVAELGPGDSFGTGLAMLLAGADTYYALDVKAYASGVRNLRILDELVQLFRARAPRPRRGWPNFDDALDADLFPSNLLPPERLRELCSDQRVQAIRQALERGVSDDGTIRIRAVIPWDSADQVDAGSLDLILSHSVLEHVRDLAKTYAACATWLRPGGWMTHQIDFTSHGMTPGWNGAWRLGDGPYWKLLAGRRDSWINRQPYSRHVELLRAADFELVRALTNSAESELHRTDLAAMWAELSDADLRCRGAFLQARKPAGH